MCGCELFQDEGQFCVGAPRTLVTDHHQGLAKLSALKATVPMLSLEVVMGATSTHRSFVNDEFHAVQHALGQASHQATAQKTTMLKEKD